MDFSNLATKSNADAGKWFRVELYGELTNLWINILGSDSDSVQKAQREQFKKLSQNTGADKKMSDETIDEMLNADLDSIVSRISAISAGEDEPDISEPVELNGITLQNDEKSFRYLITEIPAIKKFIVDKSNERKNFLSLKREN